MELDFGDIDLFTAPIGVISADDWVRALQEFFPYATFLVGASPRDGLGWQAPTRVALWGRPNSCQYCNCNTCGTSCSTVKRCPSTSVGCLFRPLS